MYILFWNFLEDSPARCCTDLRQYLLKAWAQLVRVYIFVNLRVKFHEMMGINNVLRQDGQFWGQLAAKLEHKLQLHWLCWGEYNLEARTDKFHQLVLGPHFTNTINQLVIFNKFVQQENSTNLHVLRSRAAHQVIAQRPHVGFFHKFWNLLLPDVNYQISVVSHYFLFVWYLYW